MLVIRYLQLQNDLPILLMIDEGIVYVKNTKTFGSKRCVEAYFVKLLTWHSIAILNWGNLFFFFVNAKLWYLPSFVDRMRRKSAYSFLLSESVVTPRCFFLLFDYPYWSVTTMITCKITHGVPYAAERLASFGYLLMS